MTMIPFALSSASGTAVAPINASATASAPNNGGASAFGGLVISAAGRPFEVQRITEDDFRTYLGDPLTQAKGQDAEAMRHVRDALKGGPGYVVRVVGSDAKLPVLHIAKDGSVTTEAVGLDVDPSLPEVGEPLMSVWLTDCKEASRSLELTKVEGNDDRFVISLYEKSSLGAYSLLESFECSFDPDGKDDFGQPNYIGFALSRATYMKVKVADGLTKSNIIALDKENAVFVGASAGGTPSQEDLLKGVQVLRDCESDIAGICALGIYNTSVISELASLAADWRCDFFFDVPPNSTYGAAVTWMGTLNLSNHRAGAYHMPYFAQDPFYGGDMAWGLSGAAFAAKAKGRALVVGGVAGVHYSPAGEDRGVIDRSGLRKMTGLGSFDAEAFVKARINRLGRTSTGLLMIDDAITCHPINNYLLYQHVGSTLDAISKGFFSLANSLRHNPDGITEKGLKRGMKKLLDGFVTSGALVQPRYPDEDGVEPYKLTIKQVGFDQWSVAWDVCVTGTSRRIVGEPSLLR